MVVDSFDDDSANAIATAVETMLSRLGTLTERRVERYWKMPEYFMVSLCLVSRAQVESALEELLPILGEGWQRHLLFPDDQFAVWNFGDGDFFDTSIRWACAEAFAAKI